MFRILLLPALIVASAVAAQDSSAPREAEQLEHMETAPADASDEVKTLAGMSILGNEEAPKSLVIVPWKSSQIGDGLGVTNAMDDQPRPVDKEVFLREVRYHELRSGRD